MNQHTHKNTQTTPPLSLPARSRNKSKPDIYCPRFIQQRQMASNLHDLFRHQFTESELYLSPSIMKLSQDSQETILQRVRNYQGFSEDNDPDMLHNIGYIRNEDHKIVWGIYRDDTGLRSGEDVSITHLKNKNLHLMIATAEEWWEDLPDSFF